MKDFITDEEFNILQSQGKVQDVPSSASRTPDFISDEEMARLEGSASTGYEVRPNPMDRFNKASQYRREAEQANAESQKANSVGGFLGNFGKAFVSNIASSEVGLGKTIAKTFGNQRDVYTDTINRTTGTQADLAKRIREKEARGEDATKLKQVYNDLAKETGNLMTGLEEENKLPTTGQVAGQLGGTALDLLTAGTYGKAAGAMKSGSLAQKTIPFLPKPIANTAARTIFPEVTKVAEIASKPTGILTKKGGTKVLQGAGIGYGFDVTQGLQGNRGEERDGAQAFIPGLGTVIGAGIPILSEGSQSIKNFKNPDLENLQGSINKEADELLSKTRGIIGKTQVMMEGRNVPVDKYLKDPVIFKGLKVENSRIVPDEAIGTVRNRVDALMDSKGQLLPELDKFTPKISKETIRNRAIANLKGTPADIAEDTLKINRQVDALPDELSVSEIDTFRAQVRQSARDARGLSKTNEYSALEKATRDTVFDITDNLPFDTNKEYQAINNEIKNLLAVEEFLDKTIRGQVVKGGRMTNVVGRVIGAVAGAKGGVMGSIVGSEIGGVVADILTNNQFGSSFKMRLIQNLTDDPVILKEAEKFLSKVKNYNPPQLSAPKPGAPQSSNYVPIPMGGKSTMESKAPIVNRSSSLKELLQLPAPIPNKNGVFNQGPTIRLPSKSLTAREAEEMARIQAQRSQGVRMTSKDRSTIQQPTKMIANSNGISRNIPLLPQKGKGKVGKKKVPFLPSKKRNK